MALTKEQIREWLTASCAAQGVPIAIDDQLVIRDVAVLIDGRARGPRPRLALDQDADGLAPDPAAVADVAA